MEDHQAEAKKFDRKFADETAEVSNRMENLEFVDAEESRETVNPAFRPGATEGSTGTDSSTLSDSGNIPQLTTLADKLNQGLEGKGDFSEHTKNSNSCSQSENEGRTFELAGGDNSSDTDQPHQSDEDGSDVEEDYHSAEEGDIVIDEENLKEIEETLTEEEKNSRREESRTLKESGNNLFKEGQYPEAIKVYGKGLQLCPLAFPKDRSIMYSNRAACHMRSENFDNAIEDSSKALELNPNYLKPLLRRAELYEKTEKLDEALADYTKVIEMDPSQHAARAACVRLPDQIKERNEKMKEEMLGKLKDLGNMILKPFGLSTNNFQLQQDPNSGGYSVKFNNNGK